MPQHRIPHPNLLEGLANKLHTQHLRRQAYIQAAPRLGKSKLAGMLVELGRRDAAEREFQEWLRVDGRANAAEGLGEWLECRHRPLVVDDADLIQPLIQETLSKAFEGWSDFCAARGYGEDHPVWFGPRVVLLGSVALTRGSILVDFPVLDLDPWHLGWEQQLETAWVDALGVVSRTLSYTIRPELHLERQLEAWLAHVKAETVGFPPLVSAAFTFTTDKCESQLAKRPYARLAEVFASPPLIREFDKKLDDAIRRYVEYAMDELRDRVRLELIEAGRLEHLESVLALLGLPAAGDGHPSGALVRRIKEKLPPSVGRGPATKVQLLRLGTPEKPLGHVQRVEAGRPVGMPLVLRGAQWLVLEFIWGRRGDWCDAKMVQAALGLKLDVTRTYISRLSRSLRAAGFGDLLEKEYKSGNRINTSMIEEVL